MPKYIPYKGGGELATRLVAGEVDVGTLNLSEAAAPVGSWRYLSTSYSCRKWNGSNSKSEDS